MSPGVCPTASVPKVRLRGFQVATGATSNGKGPEKHNASPTPVEGVLLLDWKLDVIACDDASAALLNDSGEVDNCRDLKIPPEIVDAVNRLRGLPGGVPTGLLTRRVRFQIGGHSCTCRILGIELPDENLQSVIVLYLTRHRSLSEALTQVSLDYHLTVREVQAIEGVVLGLTSKEVATRMNISPNTVKAFLRLVMGKMGVTTRAGIVAKLLEPDGNP